MNWPCSDRQTRQAKKTRTLLSPTAAAKASSVLASRRSRDPDCHMSMELTALDGT